MLIITCCLILLKNNHQWVIKGVHVYWEQGDDRSNHEKVQMHPQRVRGTEVSRLNEDISVSSSLLLGNQMLPLIGNFPDICHLSWFSLYLRTNTHPAAPPPHTLTHTNWQISSHGVLMNCSRSSGSQVEHTPFSSTSVIFIRGGCSWCSSGSKTVSWRMTHVM